MGNVLKMLLLMFFCANVCITAKGQSIEVTYVKAYKNHRDTTNTTPKTLKDLRYILTCNRNAAKFELVRFMENDTRKENKRFLSRGGGDGVYYKNVIDSLKLHQLESFVDGKLYLINIPFEEYQWTITNETKKISNYTCYKAFTEFIIEVPDKIGSKMEEQKYEIVVWFTPEINYSFGPAGFDGLPGLVLEKYSSSFYFIASKIVFDKNNIKNIAKPQKGTYIDKAEYDKMIKTAYSRFLMN